MKTKKIVQLALFACLSVCIYAVESLIPPILPVPGVKLGLANVITLVVIYVIGTGESLLTLLIRITITTLLFGQVMSFLFSMAGGILSWIVMVLLSKIMDRCNIWAVSVFGAFAHNGGQILIAVAVTRQLAVAYYFLFLVISSVITGVFTGICAKYCIEKAEKIKLFKI
ncbi:MAG: Gx transporter family protein [Clostridia bacterium]|nr:Gx transporter family protein [Clostridia bacterium]